MLSDYSHTVRNEMEKRTYPLTAAPEHGIVLGKICIVMTCVTKFRLFQNYGFVIFLAILLFN